MTAKTWNQTNLILVKKKKGNSVISTFTKGKNFLIKDYVTWENNCEIVLSERGQHIIQLKYNST